MPNAQCQNSGLVPGPVSMPLMGKEGYGFSVAPLHHNFLHLHTAIKRHMFSSFSCHQSPCLEVRIE